MFTLRQKRPASHVTGTALFVLALVGICCGPALAERMNSTIQEAIYEFEMKGEVGKATRLLEMVSKQGDREDREKAFFYLGKIKELSGNRTSANFYYNQSLSFTKETAKAYWLSEREAATGIVNDVLIRKKIPLRASIEKVFKGDATYLLLRNGSIKKVYADTVVDIRAGIPARSDVLKIDGTGIWYQTANRDSLLFKPHNVKFPSRAYAIAHTDEFFAKGENAIAQSAHTLTLLDKKGIVTHINETYSGCHIANYYSATGHYILNCTDNALHFISDADGSETYTLSQFDAIQKVIVEGNDVLLLSGNSLFCYRPRESLSPLWKVQFSNAEELLPFNNSIVVLEASGRVTLIDKATGFIRNIIRSDAVSIHPLALGTLGLFSSEGDLVAVDTLLHPIWHFNFAKPISAAPIHTTTNIFLLFDDSHLVGIAPHYYGKKALQSDVLTLRASAMAEAGAWDDIGILLDTLLRLEPGNAEAWLYKALQLEATGGNEKERQKAWSEAVRLSVSTARTGSMILNRYSKAIGAKFVSLLAISPKTKYPQFFGHKKNIFTIDPAAEKLICINSENGEQRWAKDLPKMTDSPVMSHNDNTLALASGFALNIYDLDKDAPPQLLQLPGKAFNIQQTKDAIYVATWNGFLLKVTRSENRLAWSRKIYSSPFIFTPHDPTIYTASLEGEIKYIAEQSGLPGDFNPKVASTVSHIARADSSIAIATDNNRLYLYSANDVTRDPVQVLLESPVVSLQTTSGHDSGNILLGLADQSFLLYSPSGAPLWKYQGKNSIFNKPYIADGLAWIDQGNEIIALSLKDGSVTHKFNTPGGAGTPFVMNKTLYSASSKRLLYAFSL